MLADEVLTSVPELLNARAVEPLPGGLTNTNYKVSTDSGAYVVRIPGADTNLLAIDRENEVHNTIAAAESGVGPRVVAYVPDQGALVLEFIEGRTQSAEDLRRGDKLHLVAQACRQLHTARPFRDDFDMFAIQRRYLEIVRQHGFRLPEGYLEFEPKVRAIEEAMLVRTEEKVPCNNDLLAENFIDAGDRFRLIDYEYSGNNDPCFELGNVWSESNLSLEQLDILIAEYYGRPSKSNVARARLWGLMSKYGWTLWGSIQEGISSIDFDFWAWSMEKYERALAEFDSPEFDRLIELVQRRD